MIVRPFLFLKILQRLTRCDSSELHIVGGFRTGLRNASFSGPYRRAEREVSLRPVFFASSKINLFLSGDFNE